MTTTKTENSTFSNTSNPSLTLTSCSPWTLYTPKENSAAPLKLVCQKNNGTKLVAEENQRNHHFYTFAFFVSVSRDIVNRH